MRTLHFSLGKQELSPKIAFPSRSLGTRKKLRLPVAQPSRLGTINPLPGHRLESLCHQVDASAQQPENEPKGIMAGNARPTGQPG